jgi:hypothetical protein
MAADSDEVRASGLDRRRLLQRAALGAGLAGVAWTTPVLTSTASAGPGSCLVQPFNWLTTVGQNNAASGPYAFGGTTLTVSSSTTSAQAAYQNRISPTTPGVGPGTPQGNQNSYYTLGIGSAGSVLPYFQYGVGATSTSTFNFGSPVSDLTFTILDIDSSGATGNGYRDIVTVNWLPATTTVTFTPVNGSPTFTGSNPFTAIGNGGNAPATSTRGNLLVEFDGPISQFQIVYRAGTVPSGGSFTTQIIGLSNLSACA